MAVTVRRTEDPARVLEGAADFLASDPVRHNVVLTLLADRVEHPMPGEYWIVERSDVVVGVVFRSPLSYLAALTPMDDDAVAAAVETIAVDSPTLPGANGDATTTAKFAGHWTEQTRSAAVPMQGQRLYEVTEVVDPQPTSGRLLAPTPVDLDLLVDWFEAFQAEVGAGPAVDVRTVVEQRLDAGHLRLWDDDGPVCLAGTFAPTSGVARIGPVYTPPERRGHGYASALVAAMSHTALDRGQRCILFTDLSNPTSNGIYRALGYRAVEEVLRYRFATGDQPG